MHSGGYEAAARTLRQGGVIACPTEAVWGLSCDPFNEAAVDRILALKERPRDKGLLLVAASMAQLEPLLASLTEAQRQRLADSWPGPVTWVIPDPIPIYPEWVRGRHDTIAVRVSAHPDVRQLCAAFAGALVSTSANRAGEEEIRSRTILESAFGAMLDFVVDGELGGADRPSQIRDLLTGAVLR
ncbi:MAG: Sua5/YciO/YrdC/YwlC family protein [Pseudohongiellaceae bacterium]